MGRKRKKGRNLSGWLVLDKPVGLSSNHALGKARWLLDAKKAGHAGTLDPLASGVLPLAFGEATKTIPFIVDATKQYEFTILFGTSTDTLDAEGKVTAKSDIRPTRACLEAALPSFCGEIKQVPPAFSAIHINGERAYKLAREGKAVEMKPRQVEVFSLQLLKHDCEAGTSFVVTCGKGTYVRSLARDICSAVGSEGHVSHLRRTRVGPFEIADAITLDALEEMVHKAPAFTLKLPVETALADIPALAVTDTEAQLLKQGRAIEVPAERIATHGKQNPVIVAKQAGIVVALMKLQDGQCRPFRVFNLD